MLSDYDLSEVLSSARTVAVVGLSNRPERASYAVASYLQRHGYQVIPVNPMISGTVLGQRVYPNLRDIPVRVDIVNVFRRSEFVPPVASDAIAIGAQALWLQVGVTNQNAIERARAAGLFVVQDRCIAIEHRRLSRYAEVAY
ncbi:MAG TPA: CoA-binding protein [Roseiflexaceae bacterium]|nr:CoA-binding protein [Roseiflexaceae bacterium]